jgi:hypothetical protein
LPELVFAEIFGKNVGNRYDSNTLALITNNRGTADRPIVEQAGQLLD